MATHTNFRDFFNQDEFSDIIIKYGKTGVQQMKCHKIILSSKSEYFKTMFRTDSRFKVSSSMLRGMHFGTNHYVRQESNAPVIPLQDDDDTALVAMLRYIYTFEYARNDEDKQSREFHLSVAKVANKYEVDELRAKALQAFSSIALALTDVEQVVDIFAALLAEDWAGEELEKVLDDLLERHLVQLAGDDRFKTLLKEHSELMVKCVERLVATHPGNVVEKKDMWRCVSCGKLTEKYPGAAMSCNDRNCGGNRHSTQCWVMRK